MYNFFIKNKNILQVTVTGGNKRVMDQTRKDLFIYFSW